MKIIYKIGDLANAQENVIAHGCNAQGKMGAGVALAIKNKFPEAFETYRNSYENYVGVAQKGIAEFRLGNIIYAVSKQRIIANCITQQYYGFDSETHGKYASYDAIDSCMQKLNKYCQSRDLSVAISLIGCGHGGCAWPVVSSIIETNFPKIQPVVYVFNQKEYDSLFPKT